MLRKRLDEAGLSQIEDPRNPCNRQWRLSTLLRSIVMGIACGAKNFQDVERLTEEGTLSARLFLGVGTRRVPDTTLRDMLCKLTNEMGQFPHALRTVLSYYSRSDLFRLVTYDAGACSAHNGKVTRELGLHYLFGLKLLTLHCLMKFNESWVSFYYNTVQLLPKRTLGKTWCVGHSGSPPVQPSQHPTNGITSTPHFVCARNASTPTGAWCPTKTATSSLVSFLAAQRRAMALAHSRSLAR